MTRNLRGRLNRLEKRPLTPDANLIPAGFWAWLLWGEELPPEDAAVAEGMLAEAYAENERTLENSPAAKTYREELQRRGLPQPTTLVGIDVLNELFRLPPCPAPAATTHEKPSSVERG